MNDLAAPRTESILSKRRLGWAGAAALIGCVACCSLPLLAAAGVGGGAASALAAWLRPGAELVVGLVVFVLALTFMALRRTSRASSCGAMCRADGSCCARGR